uniref:Bcl-3 n=3 Tax=Nematostella vectensis TaxID=45351 RepID=E5G602_NEMVE|nr:Bcl-3 [Nematostella vectensis]
MIETTLSQHFKCLSTRKIETPRNILNGSYRGVEVKMSTRNWRENTVKNGRNIKCTAKDRIREKLTARVSPMSVGICRITESMSSNQAEKETSGLDPKFKALEQQQSNPPRKHKFHTQDPEKTPAKRVCTSNEKNNSAAASLVSTQGNKESLSSTESTSGDSLETLVSASQCHLATLQDEDGDTPLHIAIAQENKNLVLYLVSLMRCLTLDIYNNLRQTPLHIAVITDQPDIVKCLIYAGANPNLPDRNGQTPAHLACQRSAVRCLYELTSSSLLDYNIRNFEGLMPLHIAVAKRDKYAIALLVQNGANVDCKDGKSGKTPLHHAIERNDLQIIKTLLDMSADINATDFSGVSPMAMANRRGLANAVRLLGNRGEDQRVDL